MQTKIYLIFVSQKTRKVRVFYIDESHNLLLSSHSLSTCWTKLIRGLQETVVIFHLLPRLFLVSCWHSDGATEAGGFYAYSFNANLQSKDTINLFFKLHFYLWVERNSELQFLDRSP